MRGFDDKFIDELKSKNNLTDVVSKYVTLEQKGRNFWGRCPFHHEKTASFSVNSVEQFYYCFGCHKSGDVISFIMEIESLDFADAVKFLAERVKMPLPDMRYDEEKLKETRKKKERIYDLLKDTAMFYVKNLRSNGASKHVEYILKRGMTNETLARFGIGASLNFNDLPIFLRDKGYTSEEINASGVVDYKDKRGYDALGGRLIIPIINQFGQVVAFGGRLLEKADFAKYKNTRETAVFSKSNNLFNLNNLKKLKNEKGLDSVIMVEGYMDVISLVQAGFLNTVASMGTALTKEQARILKRYTDKVFISYDGDFAGQKAAIRGLEILSEEGLEVKVVSLPDGLDPDDVIKKFGADGYRQLLLDAKPLIDFKLDIIERTFDISTVDGRRKYVTSALKVIAETTSSAEQDDLLKIVRDKTGVTFEALKRELRTLEGDLEVKPVETIMTVNEESDDKLVRASRFILSSYLFGKPYAYETDINDIDFILPSHKDIKGYIDSRLQEGRTVRFNDLYEVIDDEHKEELSKIAGLEVDENKDFDQAKYFFDCIRTLKVDLLDKRISELQRLYKNETDIERRREIVTEMSAILKQKNILTNS